MSACSFATVMLSWPRPYRRRSTSTRPRRLRTRKLSAPRPPTGLRGARIPDLLRLRPGAGARRWAADLRGAVGGRPGGEPVDPNGGCARGRLGGSRLPGCDRRGIPGSRRDTPRTVRSRDRGAPAGRRALRRGRLATGRGRAEALRRDGAVRRGRASLASAARPDRAPTAVGGSVRIVPLDFVARGDQVLDVVVLGVDVAASAERVRASNARATTSFGASSGGVHGASVQSRSSSRS